jgi:TonB family protein
MVCGKLRQIKGQSYATKIGSLMKSTRIAVSAIISVLIIIGYLPCEAQPVLQKFEFSECMRECIGDSTKIDRIYRNGEITLINLTAYANCAGNFEAKIKGVNDTLYLSYSQRVTKTVNEETGEVEELMEVALCDCVFKFYYTIQGLEEVDEKKIQINGATLDDINKRTIHYEGLKIALEVNFDSTWSSDEIFTVVEETARPAGGIDGFYDYVGRNLIYPADAESKRISGKVFLEFVITKSGAIDDSSVKVLKGLNKSCNDEAVRVMKHCPDWTPGKIKGQPVKQIMVLPIMFRLDEDKGEAKANN